jgi:exosortase F-associated protein
MEKRQKFSLGLLAVLMLILMYMLQRTNYCTIIYTTAGLDLPSANAQFIFNRTLRFLINDLSVILLIYVIFEIRGLVKIAFLVQLFGLFVVLPFYFYFKLMLEGPSEISSPLLSFVHRIIVNPILMLLLIPAFYFQSTVKNKRINK